MYAVPVLFIILMSGNKWTDFVCEALKEEFLASPNITNQKYFVIGYERVLLKNYVIGHQYSRL